MVDRCAVSICRRNGNSTITQASRSHGAETETLARSSTRRAAMFLAIFAGLRRAVWVGCRGARFAQEMTRSVVEAAFGAEFDEHAGWCARRCTRVGPRPRKQPNQAVDRRSTGASVRTARGTMRGDSVERLAHPPRVAAGYRADTHREQRAVDPDLGRAAGAFGASWVFAALVLRGR
jgi:hypothetical protein